jgi:ubiquinone/menaquinone biosynthesis C-methylase UbiE
VAQITSIPHLPFEDNTFNLVSAFSVFTHIEAFETAWLMELKRILKPGGLAWITIHSENTWREMEPGWPLYDALARHPDFERYLQGRDALPRERLIFRQSLNRSYSSNVFYTTDYTKSVF